MAQLLVLNGTPFERFGWNDFPTFKFDVLFHIFVGFLTPYPLPKVLRYFWRWFFFQRGCFFKFHINLFALFKLNALEFYKLVTPQHMPDFQFCPLQISDSCQSCNGSAKAAVHAEFNLLQKKIERHIESSVNYHASSNCLRLNFSSGGIDGLGLSIERFALGGFSIHDTDIFSLFWAGPKYCTVSSTSLFAKVAHSI